MNPYKASQIVAVVNADDDFAEGASLDDLTDQNPQRRVRRVLEPATAAILGGATAQRLLEVLTTQ